MVAFEPLARDIGRMLQALSLMVAVTVVIALIWGEFYAVPALVLSGLLPFATGTAPTSYFGGTAEVGKLHGMMIAASGWFLVALIRGRRTLASEQRSGPRGSDPA